MLKLTTIFLSLFSTQIWADYPLWRNIHTVQEAQLYRAATLKPDVLDELLKKHSIKTVINLRGAAPGADWYDMQELIITENNATLHNIGMSASRLPHRKDLLKLIELFRTVERPILIHCQAGADRTGEAAAMWVMDYMGGTKEEALKQLDIKYKHSRIHMPAKSYFIREIYQGARWAVDNYYPCEHDWMYYSKWDYCQD